MRSIVAIVTGALVLGAGVAATPGSAAIAPWPRVQEGAGAEPTSGRGLWRSVPFRTGSAVVRLSEGLFGNVLILYLFPRAGLGCEDTSDWFREGEVNVQVTLATERPRRLPVGRPFRPEGAVLRAVVDDVNQYGFGSSRRIVITRIDTLRVGARWHGRLILPEGRVHARQYRFRGSFDAEWCGTRRRP